RRLTDRTRQFGSELYRIHLQRAAPTARLQERPFKSHAPPQHSVQRPNLTLRGREDRLQKGKIKTIAMELAAHWAAGCELNAGSSCYGAPSKLARHIGFEGIAGGDRVDAKRPKRAAVERDITKVQEAIGSRGLDVTGYDSNRSLRVDLGIRAEIRFALAPFGNTCQGEAIAIDFQRQPAVAPAAGGVTVRS